MDSGIIIELFGSQSLFCEYFTLIMEHMYRFKGVLLVSLYDQLLSEDYSASYKLGNSKVKKEKKHASSTYMIKIENLYP